MMTLLRWSHETSGFLALTGLVFCLAQLGCDDKEPKQNNVPVATGGGTGTSTGSGGVSNGAGSPNIGTTAGAGGGVDGTAGAGTIGNGGAGTAGDSGVGAAGAAVTSCSSDLECKSAKQLCDLTLKRCVQCILSVDCTDGSACVAGVCGGAAGCKTNAECAASSDGKACDVARGRCVPCVAASDCQDPANSECVNNACVAVTSCQNSLQCTSAAEPVCNRSATPSRCVQCIADADCLAAGNGKVCSDNLCHAGCSTNSDCSTGTLCNTSVVPNFCAECATNSDCAKGRYCSKGSCVADICAAGVDQACFGNGVSTCTVDGDGFGPPQACPSGQTCLVAQSRASCSGGGGAGGSGGAGGNGGAGGKPVTPIVCSPSPGTVNPCYEIPAFTGTQTVDAMGDDFCTIPAFELTFANAANVNNNKVPGGSTADFTQRAVAQVAWSAEAFHAYVEVIGTPVRSNTTVDKPWDGDAIELMITTSNNVTGSTSSDTNALHVIANHGVAVTVKSDGAAGSHTPVGTGQFKGTLTTTGYAVELKLPWPNAATLTSGTLVRFDMAMNVDTASVDPTIQGRDAQAVLAMAALTGGTSCASAPAPFCDDRLWCPTTLK